MMIKTFEGIFTRFGWKQGTGTGSFVLDANLNATLMDQADREQMPAEELCKYLLRSGLAKRKAAEEIWQQWETLSGREQDIIAYICLQYNDRQMATKMEISANTVNWYVRKILEKFNFHSEAEIQIKFSGWDFGNWRIKAQE